MQNRRGLAAMALAAAATALIAPSAGATPAPPAVHAVLETPALFDDDAGGSANADDPAIWYDHAHPGRSLVVATAKEGGLRVYGLDGHQIQSLPAPPAPAAAAEPGRFNNVDLLPGLRFPEVRPTWPWSPTVAGTGSACTGSTRRGPPRR